MRYRTHQVKTQKTQRFVINLFSNLNGFRVLNDIDLRSINSLPSILKLSRLSEATYFNNQGVLSDSAVDKARFDYKYDGTKWVNQGLLVEKQSTNHIFRSSNWSNVNPPTASNNLTYTAEGYAVMDNTTKEVHFRFYVNAPQSFNRYVTYLTKTINGSKPALGIGAHDQLDANIVDGQGGEYSNAATSAFPVTEGFFKTTAKKTLSKADGGSGGLIKYLGNKKSTIYVYFAQEESLLYPTSLIKTRGEPVTRSPDNLQLSLSNYTGSIKLTYKRQDTGITETKWIDYTGVTNPILSNQFNVGVWLHRVVVYNRILTAEEKANA